VTGKAAS